MTSERSGLRREASNFRRFRSRAASPRRARGRRWARVHCRRRACRWCFRDHERATAHHPSGSSRGARRRSRDRGANDRWEACRRGSCGRAAPSRRPELRALPLEPMIGQSCPGTASRVRAPGAVPGQRPQRFATGLQDGRIGCAVARVASVALDGGDCIAVLDDDAVTTPTLRRVTWTGSRRSSRTWCWRASRRSLRLVPCRPRR